MPFSNTLTAKPIPNPGRADVPKTRSIAHGTRKPHGSGSKPRTEKEHSPHSDFLRVIRVFRGPPSALPLRAELEGGSSKSDRKQVRFQQLEAEPHRTGRQCGQIGALLPLNLVFYGIPDEGTTIRQLIAM